jgi:hypothetical protein
MESKRLITTNNADKVSIFLFHLSWFRLSGLRGVHDSFVHLIAIRILEKFCDFHYIFKTKVLTDSVRSGIEALILSLDDVESWSSVGEPILYVFVVMFEEAFCTRSESEVTMESFVGLIERHFFRFCRLLFYWLNNNVVNNDDKISSWKKDTINTKQDKEKKHYYSSKVILEANQCGVQEKEEKWKK